MPPRSQITATIILNPDTRVDTCDSVSLSNSQITATISLETDTQLETYDSSGSNESINETEEVSFRSFKMETLNDELGEVSDV